MKSSRLAMLASMAFLLSGTSGARIIVDESSDFAPRSKRENRPVTEGDVERINKAEVKRARKAQIRANGGKR